MRVFLSTLALVTVALAANPKLTEPRMQKADTCKEDYNEHSYCAGDCPADWNTDVWSCGIFSSDTCCVAPDDFQTTPAPTTIAMLPTGECGTSKYGCQAGADLAVSRIVGGVVTYENEFPWQASLKYLGSHSCGGSIINDQWILTAAHCVQGSMATASRWTVSLGNHRLAQQDASQVDVKVVEVIDHPQYGRFTNDYDVALMRLEAPVTLNDNVRKVCLANVTDGHFTGDVATVTGWGTTRAGGSISNELRKVAVPVISNAQCDEWYSQYTITDRMICAGLEDGGKDSCQGDSGGPMTVSTPDCKFLQVGIVSWGVGCAGARQPGVYTRVSDVRQWIEETVHPM